MNKDEVHITRREHRGVPYELRRRGELSFGYVYIDYELIPHPLRTKLFWVAAATGGEHRRFFTPVTDTLRDLMRRPLNGCEWRILVGAPLERSYLAVWWDYSHLWDNAEAWREWEYDAKRSIDNLIAWVREHGFPFMVRCGHCGHKFDEGSGWRPEFGRWEEVCVLCKPAVEEYKRNHGSQDGEQLAGSVS